MSDLKINQRLCDVDYYQAINAVCDIEGITIRQMAKRIDSPEYSLRRYNVDKYRHSIGWIILNRICNEFNLTHYEFISLGVKK